MSNQHITIELRLSPELVAVLARLADAISLRPAYRAGKKIDTPPLQPSSPAEHRAPPAQARPAGDERELLVQPPVTSPGPPAQTVMPAVAETSGPTEAPPEPASSSVGGGRPRSTWSNDRRGVLQRDWPAGVPTSAIVAALNKLPGPEVDGKRTGIQAATMGLRRPVGHRGTMAIPMPASAPRELVTPIAADSEQIRSWAEAHGMRMRKFDLDAVNAKCRAIGHPGFILKPSRRVAA